MAQAIDVGSDTLVCKHCDMFVSLECGYDGYIAQCGHDSMALGFDNQRPYSWERFEDVVNPSGFVVTRSTGWEDDGAVGQEILCGECRDDGDVTLSFENVSLDTYDTKVTVECHNDHSVHTDRHLTKTATVYKDSEAYGLSHLWRNEE